MPIVLSLLWKLRAYFIVVIIVAGGYMFLVHQGVEKEKANEAVVAAKVQAAQEKERASAQAAINSATAAYEAQLKKERDHGKVVEGKLYVERQKRIYSTCIVPVDGVRLRNAALKE